MDDVVPDGFVPGCDAPEPRPVYVVRVLDGEPPVYGCRCMVCTRCGKHTGNTTQGHYWSWCRLRGAAKVHHFCCPGDCELENPDWRSRVPPVHPGMAALAPAHLPRVGYRADLP